MTVGPFVSEMDEAERLREKHETKRLLYVALTRARDRLYLASALKDGVMAPGRGSLGEVLPQSMKELFAKAGLAALERPIGPPVTWTSASGARFEWRPCRRAASASLWFRDCQRWLAPTTGPRLTLVRAVPQLDRRVSHRR